MVTLSQIMESLDLLTHYPAIAEYIKNFNGHDGFMYTIETDPRKIQLNKQMGDLLDSNGMHSGASWGCMLRTVQSILNGHTTKEQVIQRYTEQMNRFKSTENE